MPTGASFKAFETELNRLVSKFEKNIHQLKGPGYDEASLRLEYLDPLFRALGWDMENRAGLIHQHREVEIESRTTIGGRQKRADYLFRADKRDRFVCEAKKPAEELNARYAFQAKRYAWNKDLPLAVLTDFEEIKIYIVGGKPFLDQPEVGLWKSWHFKQFPLIAEELWNLLARENVGSGSIDKLIESLPKRPTGKGKLRQQWLIKPDRSRALDTDFLEFLDEARRDLASDLIRHNDRADLLEGNKLNEAVQLILDRILFLRICEDRDIDTGALLQSLVDLWRKHYGKEDGLKPKQTPLQLISIAEPPPPRYEAATIAAPRDSLWFSVVSHFRALDRRPPSHVPFFNGNLFKPHFSETLLVSDEWLAGFIGELSNDESPYLFSVIKVEILGSIYERFLGKVVRPQGTGVSIVEKPEVRKAGGVYYTPSYIVNYIVEQTVGKLLDDVCHDGGEVGSVRCADRDPITGRRSAASLPSFSSRTNALRILDPACGSGSFLIRAFERVCEHWQIWLTRNPGQQNKKLCWVDPDTKDVHLTVALKREILRNNIYGVDLDSGAVEVTQLSLYLKMLENENRTTLARERELFADEVALLPPLQDNIKCGNSLIASDFSMIPEDLVRVHAFDWPVQFEKIMKG
ncbi:MAG: N-6 DNA methylase, partial [Verrucomicrobia bacterium]|nr:N-6 DNA methylase [Verrucomicrobiota bacterium]